MSILSNIYWKKNQEISIKIDRVALSDYAIIKIDFYRDYKKDRKGYPDIIRFPDEYFSAYMPLDMAYALAELLFKNSEHKERGVKKDYLPKFLDGKIKECEYITE